MLSVAPTKGSNGRMINDRGLFQGYIPAFSCIVGVPAEDLCVLSSTVSQQK